ncbi:MAG: hypothetical protein IPM37_02265 [Hahellaceae bacterium]|nr:hypothetical protein [Hahellaceae bacterium]
MKRRYGNTASALGLLTFLTLGGCGWFTNSAVDQAGDQPNSIGGARDQINDEDGELPNPNPPTPTNPKEIRFFVEATDGMQSASTAQLIWNLLTPGQAWAMDAGDTVSSARISVRQLDYQGNLINGDGVSNSDYSVILNEDNSFSVIFSDALPDRLDLVVVAQLSNGKILRHALPPNNQSFRISVGSEYAVRAFFNSLSSSQELTNLTVCENDDTDCANQVQLRHTNWVAMMAALQDFEITIPDNYSLEEALELMGSRLDVRDYTEQFIATIKETKLNVVQGEGIAPVMDARDGTYNSVYFALGMNQGVANSDTTAVFSRRSAETLPATSGDVTNYIYPNFVFSPTILGVINNLLVETLPFTRNSLELVSPNNYVAGPVPEAADINKFVGTSISYLNSAGLMDLARLQVQSLTRTNSDAPLGWLTNPHFTRLYTARSAESAFNSDSLATAFWSTGQLLELEKNGSNYDRVQKLEDLNTFGWIFHSLASEDSDPFSAIGLDGNTYTVISLANQLNESLSLNWTSSIDYWSIDGSTVVSQQPLPTDPENSGGADIFSTQILARSTTDLGEDLVESSTPENTPLTLEALPTLVYNQTSKSHDQKYRGRLQVSDWVGMSDPLGNVLSFNLGNGQGIAHAVRVSTQVPDIANATFTLYGNSVSVDDNNTYYHNHNTSTLSFNAGVATLNLKEITVSADHLTSVVSAPTNTSESYIVQPTASIPALGAIRNQIALNFADPQGGSTPFILEGAAASAGNLLILRVNYGNRVGLLYGFKTLSLTEDSN